MWATFRFMMNWYVSWSGVRTMSIVWRLPESWIGPNFFLARAGGGTRQESTASVTATAERHIDIPPSELPPDEQHCHRYLRRKPVHPNVYMAEPWGQSPATSPAHPWYGQKTPLIG